MFLNCLKIYVKKYKSGSSFDHVAERCEKQIFYSAAEIDIYLIYRANTREKKVTRAYSKSKARIGSQAASLLSPSDSPSP